MVVSSPRIVREREQGANFAPEPQRHGDWSAKTGVVLYDIMRGEKARTDQQRQTTAFPSLQRMALRAKLERLTLRPDGQNHPRGARVQAHTQLRFVEASA